jgi:integrase
MRLPVAVKIALHEARPLPLAGYSTCCGCTHRRTFGRRLRAAGVSFEDRQDLLGHRSTRVTTDYSAAELRSLLDAANRVQKSRKSPAMTVLRLTG